jgi:cytidylate kinase
MDELDIKRINFSVSGWPGSGATTLALILASIFEREYIYIGSIYRYLGTKMGFSDKGINRPQFDEYIEGIVGKTIDQFSDFKLLNESNLILDSDITAFRIGKHPKVYSIFLTTPFEVRKERIKSKLEMEFLDERDSVLSKQYQKLWGVEYFNLDLINQKHNLVFDNSNMGLELELKEVFKNLKEFGPFTDLTTANWEQIQMKSQKVIEDLETLGKESIVKTLQDMKLFPDPLSLIYEITSLFPEEVSSFPDHLKKIFLP